MSIGCQIDGEITTSFACAAASSGLSGRRLDQFLVRNSTHRDIPVAPNEVLGPFSRSVAKVKKIEFFSFGHAEKGIHISGFPAY